MKKVLLACCSLLFFYNYPENDIIGLPWWKTPPQDRRVEPMAQSFMFTRPIYQNSAAQKSEFWHDAVYNKQGCFLTSVQVLPLFQQSITPQPAARYFLINHKNTLVFKGDAVPPFNPNDRDVRAEWLRLPADFVGTFSLEPHQKQGGIWFEVNHDLKKYIHHDYFKALWIAAAFPFQVVENQLQLGERVIATNTNQQPNTIIQAFNDSRLSFGKITPGKKRTFSVAEVYLKLGTTFLNRDGFQIGVYGGTIFPLFGHQNPEFMFSPMLGHDRHFGFLSGADFQLPLNSDTQSHIIAFIFSIENQFFLRNFQRRSFDLRFKPWSRYMLLNKNDGTKNISAINALSPRCKVQPFNFLDMTIGFRVQSHGLEAEVGYNLWAHPSEQIQLEKPFPIKFGIAGDGTLVPGTNIGATASASTINNLAPIDRDKNGNPTFVPIHEYDLDFKSAAARDALVHHAYASVAYWITIGYSAFFFGVAGYIEISQKNTALSNWGVWGKLGGSF